MKVIWTKRAKQDYLNVIEYIHENWGIKEVSDFVGKTNDTIKTVATNSKAFVASTKRKNVYKGFVTKHNSLFYQVRPRKKEIILLTFWDNRQNPQKLKH
ncbi:type II toxin-antitoxin system RelE/ParE family toxin [Plebeiibacterium marinum]|uniref:Type II toxin-antitoxin system RelE/ParE family toxin n=1 Tax=Plebeiibacterium marinum TaxID=2992111 RepID=A0AAE3MGC3_9BACT|nr:type II toxin-antitoxin system RelE/ParE family toxin [Plebeiobacterium marinum]MCW3807030.1 type II toxin-antitoxin system RelE/ParE family toxin [Plebeiobacterium marinum]